MRFVLKRSAVALGECGQGDVDGTPGMHFHIAAQRRDAVPRRLSPALSLFGPELLPGGVGQQRRQPGGRLPNALVGVGEAGWQQRGGVRHRDRRCMARRHQSGIANPCIAIFRQNVEKFRRAG